MFERECRDGRQLYASSEALREDRIQEDEAKKIARAQEELDTEIEQER